MLPKCVKNASNQYFVDQTFQRKKQPGKGRFDQKLESLKSSMLLNKILKRTQQPAIRKILPTAEDSTTGLKSEKPQKTLHKAGFFSITDMKLFRGPASQTRKYGKFMIFTMFWRAGQAEVVHSKSINKSKINHKIYDLFMIHLYFLNGFFLISSAAGGTTTGFSVVLDGNPSGNQWFSLFFQKFEGFGLVHQNGDVSCALLNFV